MGERNKSGDVWSFDSALYKEVLASSLYLNN